ncbi:VOC family protein [Frankia sp. CNm7]|nr:VOC family protein [Frankia nepalensis]MBL7501966.1 VOC family protein [Frankia nepalensis]MBL7510596.1 VOC family protein [Frankia nepalensis]MBL7517336.1 VOC family protein [Frankia nepalensis]
MSSATGTHRDLHGERRREGPPGRADNPVVKVCGLAWLEFRKPDLDRAEIFAQAFGFGVAWRTPDELWLRGSDAGAPCLIVRRGPASALTGLAFAAADRSDVHRLASATGMTVAALPEGLGGVAVDLVDPNGLTVRVVSDTDEVPGLQPQHAYTMNVGHDTPRVNAAQRPPRAPAVVQRLGHVVLQSTTFQRTLDWYLRHLGLIVSDFLYFPGQRDRGPTMSFVRCDLGLTPADHHTIALALGPSNRYVHSAYQVADLDALAAGGEYLRELGFKRSWGIGRHLQGSQIFDYWRDPDGVLMEHYSDGDLFDHTVEPGWAPMTASGLAQWGPRATKDFLGIAPGRRAVRELVAMLTSLREDNEWDVARMRGLMKVAAS